MKWIKVTERLPERREFVLFACKDGYVGIGFLNEHNVWFENSIFEEEVIAWMPLPEYKEYEG